MRSHGEGGNNHESLQGPGRRRQFGEKAGSKSVHTGSSEQRSIESENVQQDESLLKQIAELREATAESRIQELATENDTLNKHFERLSHLQLVNTFPGRADCPQGMTPGRGKTKVRDVCYSCGGPGHMQGNARMDEAILAFIGKAETKTNVNLAVSELMRETEFIFVAHSGAKPVTVCWTRAVT